MVCFDALFNLASKYMLHGTKLSKFAAFVMFFIKLRLSLQDEGIAFRFGCYVSTLSRSFHHVPCRCTVLRSVQNGLTEMCFVWSCQHHLDIFKKCVVIIDCSGAEQLQASNSSLELHYKICIKVCWK